MNKITLNHLADKIKQSVDIAFPVKDKFVSLQSSKYEGRYTLPGGKVEIGEDLTAAAIREAYEETGLVATRIMPYYAAPLFSTREKSTLYICTCFVATHWTGEMTDSNEGTVVLGSRDQLLEGPYGDFYQDMFQYYDRLFI